MRSLPSIMRGEAVVKLSLSCVQKPAFTHTVSSTIASMFKSTLVFTRLFRTFSLWLSTTFYSLLPLLISTFYPLSTRPIKVITNYKLITYY